MMLCSKTTHTHTHTHTHTNTHTLMNTKKYLHCYKIYKCNTYELNKCVLISKSVYRYTAQYSTNVNINAQPPITPRKVQHNLQNSINILTNRSINNNVLHLQVIQKS